MSADGDRHLVEIAHVPVVARVSPDVPAEVLEMDPTVALVVAFVVPSITVLIWEAVALRRQDCYLPANGWGRMADRQQGGQLAALEAKLTAAAQALAAALAGRDDAAGSAAPRAPARSAGGGLPAAPATRSSASLVKLGPARTHRSQRQGTRGPGARAHRGGPRPGGAAHRRHTPGAQNGKLSITPRWEGRHRDRLTSSGEGSGSSGPR
jgi:hypothetical protein